MAIIKGRDPDSVEEGSKLPLHFRVARGGERGQPSGRERKKEKEGPIPRKGKGES